MPLAFENYHSHTSVSNCLALADSVASYEDYAKAYRERDMHCLFTTEHGNRGDAWQCFRLSEKAAADGYKLTPIASCEAYFVPDRFAQDRSNAHLMLIAKDTEGFKQLNEILSESNMSGFYYRNRVDFDLLSRLDPSRFVCTTACIAGPFKYDNYESILQRLHGIFGRNLYLEIQPHLHPKQVEMNRKILAFYRQSGYPLIFATDSHYLKREDKVLRETLLESSHIKYEDEDGFDLFLPTADEAYDLLMQQGVFSDSQIREAMENTLQFRDFEGVMFDRGKKIPNPYKQMSVEERNEMYRAHVLDGYERMYGSAAKEQRESDMKELASEMDAIMDTGTADYFLILEEIIRRGLKKGGILTQTGRGSAISFSTNHMLGLTSINRLRCPIKLYPERFISKDRLASGSLPDFDANMSNIECFEEAGKEMLGEYGCLPMVAFGTTKVLSAFKLLARAKSIPFEEANKVSDQLKKYELAMKYWGEQNDTQDDDEDDEDKPKVSSYVSAEYLDLVDESALYMGIVNNISPHPCAHLLLDQDIRREVGVIRLKAKSGSKKPVYAAFIDGATADEFGMVKMDYLAVDTVMITANTFKRIGQPVMPVEELLAVTRNDRATWSMYEKGYTMGLNQVEKEKTTERVMQYKPRNIVELSAFVAAVRPGFKSMFDTFVSRRRFSYGIESLDKALQTKEIPSSFLVYQEQILTILQVGGVSAADAYSVIKAISKKKPEKIQKHKETFLTGYVRFLTDGGMDEAEAKSVSDRIWQIVGDSASYLFCGAHALSVACDSLYGAYLKAHSPYDFYAVLMQNYAAKGDKDRIAKVKVEMRKAFGIRVVPCRFRQDNRDYYIDKDKKSISDALTSVKHISKRVADTLYGMRDEFYPCFVDLLYDMEMHPVFDATNITVLIKMGYFSEFGTSGKLLDVFNEFRNGASKFSKNHIKPTQEKRLCALRAIESELPERDIPAAEQIRFEIEHYGVPISEFPSEKGMYAVLDVDDKYSPKIRLYNVSSGATGMMKVRKPNYLKQPLKEGDVISLVAWEKKPAYQYVDGKARIKPGVTELWMKEYEILPEVKNDPKNVPLVVEGIVS